MTMNGNYLFVRTCHTMYKSSDGLNHQANVTFSVNTSNMSIVDKFTSIMNTSLGYVSHSFNQFIRIDNGTLLGVDHGDAYPRSIVLLKYSTDISNGYFVPDYFYNACQKINVLPFSGAIGDNYTGASAGGFEYSDSSYLIAGNYDSNGYGSARNVFVSSVSKSGGTPVIRYFTDYTGTDAGASTPHLLKTGNNSFVLMWSNKGYVYYTALDGNGQQTGSTYKMAGNLSDCVPAVINGKLIWYTWYNGENTFYSINLSNLSENHATRIINGHKFVNNKSVNGLMKRTCNICGYQDSVSVPVKINPWKKSTESNYYNYVGNSIYLNIGESAKLWWTPEFDPNNSSYSQLSECEINNSDNSVASMKMDAVDMATFTAQKAGKSTFTVKSKYDPDCIRTIDIYVNMLNKSWFTLSLSKSSYTYDGTEHKPTVALKTGNTTLTEGTDFKISYDRNLTDAGTVTVTADGIGRYTGSISSTFRIYPQSMDRYNTSVSVDPAYYNGSEQKPAVHVTYNGKTLTLDKDYSISYSDNINVTNYGIVYINGQGNYSGTLLKYFQIKSADISKYDITLSANSFKYNGTHQKPEITVKSGNRILTANTDYVVSYSNNMNAGTASITITGMGNYINSATRTFEIGRVPASISAEDLILNQNTKKCTVVTDAVTDGNITLTSSDPDIVQVSGTKIIPAAPGKAMITIMAEQGQNYEAAEKTITVTVRPLTATKLSLKSKTKGQVTVSWTPAKSISGYQIYYSTYSNLKGAKYITAKNTARSATLKKLTSKKKYYVRIRTYKTVNGQKYYSSWSSIKSVKVK